MKLEKALSSWRVFDVASPKVVVSNHLDSALVEEEPHLHRLGERGTSGAPLAGTGWTGGGTAAGSAPCSSRPKASTCLLSAAL